MCLRCPSPAPQRRSPRRRNAIITGGVAFPVLEDGRDMGFTAMEVRAVLCCAALRRSAVEEVKCFT